MVGAFPGHVGLGCIKMQAGKQHPPMTLTSAPVWVTEKRKWEPNHPFPSQVTFGDVILIAAIEGSKLRQRGWDFGRLALRCLAGLLSAFTSVQPIKF